MEKDILCKWKPKESQSGNPISEKIDFKIKNVIRDKEGRYILIKASIQEDITILNIYALNIEAPQYISQTLTGIRGEIYSNTVI